MCLYILFIFSTYIQPNRYSSSYRLFYYYLHTGPIASYITGFCFVVGSFFTLYSFFLPCPKTSGRNLMGMYVLHTKGAHSIFFFTIILEIYIVVAVVVAPCLQFSIIRLI
jgi:hypothetical protein